MPRFLFARPLGATDRESLEAQAGAIRQKVEHLSPREFEVLGTMLMGLTSEEAGTALGISKRTIDVHKQHILQKLEARNAFYAVRMATVAGY